MVKILISYEVADFAKWKAVFDSQLDLRKSGGMKSLVIYRGLENPNSISMITEWDSVEAASKFNSSPQLREAQAKAGLIGRPGVYTMQPL